MPIETKFTKLVGVKIPIMQGGMHYVGYASMAAAVSNAGGLGTITALTLPSPDALRAEIRLCKSLTNKPFAVNVTLLPALAPPDYPGYLKVIAEEGIKVVETAGRSPDEAIKFLKKHNITIIHKCVSIRHAISAQKAGADMISMDGFECGGHPGEEDVTNWILYAKAARLLKIPFLASGGSADPTQLAAAITFGAQGIVMGTRFMATRECPIHENIKQALVDNDERNTTLVMRSLKNTERVFKNKTAKKVVSLEKEVPGDINIIRPYVKGENYRKSFQESGDTDSSVWSCGQSMGLITDIPTCKELIERFVSETEQIFVKRMQENIKISTENKNLPDLKISKL